ncbi:MAG: O-antigen ligase family protein [Ferruginibacter sp.]
MKLEASTFLFLLYIIFFTSMVCSFRPITSISIALILLTGLIKNKIDSGSIFGPRLKNNLLITCCIYYVVQVVLIINSPNHDMMARHIELKASLVIVPLAVCAGNYFNDVLYQRLMKYYVWIIAAAMLFCLLTAFYKYYFLQAGSSVFFYHALVAPFKQHAIQVSILIFIGIVYLLENAKKGVYLQNRLLHFLFVFYLIGFIVLLSSKLVIVFTALCCMYYFLVSFRKTRFRLPALAILVTGLLMIVLVLTTKNQVSKRFNEIIHTNMDLVQQKQFDPGIYFDGLQFRLLQWRFVKEILTEKNAWLTGVSDDAQILLDKKYVDTHMYQGNGTGTDRGYLGYNTHNTFLEALLQSGVIGLAAFVLICIAIIQLVVKKKGRELFFVVTLLLAYSLNESMLERQYSITIFTFFPLFLYFSIGSAAKRSD